MINSATSAPSRHCTTWAVDTRNARRHQGRRRLFVLIVLAAAVVLTGQLGGGTVEGRFSSQVESGGSQFSAAANFSAPEAAQ